MYLILNKFPGKIAISCFVLLNVISLSGLSAPAYAGHLLALQLAPTPFKPSMCNLSKENSSIHIFVAKHRDFFLQKVPGQHQPKDRTQAQQKDYVHFVTLADLTDGHIANGAIGFDNRYAVIFDKTHPKGLSRPKFLEQLSARQRLLGEMALNTFLRLHPVFNAAIDTCRLHPAFPDYANDDHLLRIEEGQLTFKELVNQYNNQPSLPKNLYSFESGAIGGYIDPEAGKGTNVSYQAMNPLNFYIQTSYP